MSSRGTFSAIEDRASEWVVAMNDRTVSLEERARFERWLAADPEHERIYKVQKSAWNAIASMPHLLEEDARPALPRWRRYTPVAAAASILIALAIVFSPRLLGPARHFETRTAQVKDIHLEDGTLVTLGASSRLEVDFTSTRRRVVLAGGEAFFEVTRDTARPFVVEAGGTQVRVLGTKFDVHYGADAVRVAVMEGRVEVMKSQTSRLLTAGEAVVAPRASALAAVQSVDAENLGAWRAGRRVYIDARLGEVIADVNRYYGGRIGLADASLGDLQLTAAFRADQIDRMLEVLTAALPLKATRDGENRIVLSAR